MNAAAGRPAGMYPTCRTRRGVAQLGSASALGAEGRGFKSRHPDHLRHLRAIRAIMPGAAPGIVFWAAQLLRLLCRLRARVSPAHRPRTLPGAESPDLSGPGETQAVSHKETEP